MNSALTARAQRADTHSKATQAVAEQPRLLWLSAWLLFISQKAVGHEQAQRPQAGLGCSAVLEVPQESHHRERDGPHSDPNTPKGPAQNQPTLPKLAARFANAFQNKNSQQ